MEASLDDPSSVLQIPQISDEITHALHRSWFFDPQTITVVEDAPGKIRLEGTVPSMHDRRRAAVAAWSHPGVIDVVNHVEVV